MSALETGNTQASKHFICLVFAFKATAPKEFENAALFLWLGLPSTLIHHEISKTLFKHVDFEDAGLAF